MLAERRKMLLGSPHPHPKTSQKQYEFFTHLAGNTITFYSGNVLNAGIVFDAKKLNETQPFPQEFISFLWSQTSNHKWFLQEFRTCHPVICHVGLLIILN